MADLRSMAAAAVTTVVVAAWAGPAPAVAPEGINAMRASIAGRPAWGGAFIGRAGAKPDWTAISFVTIWPTNATKAQPFIVAQLTRKKPGADSVTWIDGRRCPVMRRLLDVYANLEVPHFRPPGLSPPSQPPALDGGDVIVWGVAASDPQAVASEMSIDGDQGVAAEWARATLRELATCEQRERPV